MRPKDKDWDYKPGYNHLLGYVDRHPGNESKKAKKSDWRIKEKYIDWQIKDGKQLNK